MVSAISCDVRFGASFESPLTQLRLFSELSNHPSNNSAEIARPFRMLRAIYRASLVVLDRIQMGVIIVDKRDRVIVKNREAERILDTTSQVYIDGNGHLSFIGPEARDMHQSLAQTNDAFPGSWHMLEEEDGGIVIVDIVPLDGFENGSRAAAVILTDPANRPSIFETRMGEAYGLTDAELTVVSLIIDGMAPEEISGIRGTAVETTRSQIKSALRKTNSRSKVDLVRLATSLTPPVKRSPS